MKKRTLIIIVLIVACVAVLIAWVIKRELGQRPGITVVSAGPLDIRLWGIRPDAGGVIYDTKGKKICQTLGVATWDWSSWADDVHRRDFIFELPDTEEPVLLTPLPRVSVSGEKIPLGGSFAYSFVDYKGKKLLWLRTTFPRTFRKSILGGLWRADVPIDAIDLTLRYYYGPPGKAAFTLKGPFRPEAAMTSEDGMYKVAFKKDAGTNSYRYAQFELSTGTYFHSYAPVVAYDSLGKRHLVTRGSGHSSLQGSRIEYTVDGVPLKKLAAVAFGEDPNHITFKNIRLDVPRRKRRTHADYLDKMAEKLELNLTPKKLADYRFKSLVEVIEVLDIVRGGHITGACATLVHGDGHNRNYKLDAAKLSPLQAQSLRRAALQWTQAMDPELRVYATRIGLQCKWPEFVEPAFELLNYRHVHDCPSAPARRVNPDAAYALVCYGEQLSPEDIDRIKHILLHQNDRDILQSFKRCLRSPKSQARIKALWDLADDDRPWLWWYAIDRLAYWDQFKDKQNSLADKLKLRLFLVRGPAGFSNPEQIATEAYSLLGELLTQQLRRLDSGTFYKVLDRIARHPDRKYATSAMIAFLRRLDDYHYAVQAVVDRIVKYINLWHGQNIGELGSDITDETDDLHTYDWPAITAEAIEWYDSRNNAVDANCAR
ncbi:MAG: hypothetical protein KAY65_06285 [Planctomycetes bacterium]|nr:hypothetical protein [Planctomycetota bacterium]